MCIISLVKCVSVISLQILHVEDSDKFCHFFKYVYKYLYIYFNLIPLSGFCKQTGLKLIF